MSINLIAAVSLNGCIGLRSTNAIPWGMDKYPEDMKHFRSLTAGSTVIMGSKTFDSISRALPKRRNLVITRSPHKYKDKGVETFASLDKALKASENDEHVWIIGGGSIYQQALGLVDKLYITVIPDTVIADNPDDLVLFPFLAPLDFQIIDMEKITLSEEKRLYCYVYNRETRGQEKPELPKQEGDFCNF